MSSFQSLDLFFDLCKKIGVKTVARAVNHHESKMNTKNQAIENSVIKAYGYFEKQAKKFGMDLQLEPWADAIIELYNNREKYITIAKNGYETYKARFTPEIYTKNLVKINIL